MKLRGKALVVAAMCSSLVMAPVSAWAETSSEVREQARQIQVELDELQGRIAEGEQRVDELQDQVNQLADESIELQGQIIGDRQRLADMVAESYKMNADSRILAMILTCSTMDDLVSQIYYAQKVSDWQADCVTRLTEDKEALVERMRQIDDAKIEQEETLETLEAQRDDLGVKVDQLNEKASVLQAQEEEAARKAAEEARRKAEEARRKAEEERKAREAREAAERARMEAVQAGHAAGDITAVPTKLAGGGWITCIASAYSIPDNDPPGSTATASGIPLDDSVPTVAMPMSMDPSRFYGSRIEISYNGMSVIATVTDCGDMGGGSRGLDLTPGVFRAFGFSDCDSWGLRTVSYRFI